MNLRLKAGQVLIGLVVLAMGLGPLSSTAAAQDGGLAAPIEGSWIFNVSGMVSFTALASFGAGGTWIATGSLDHLAPQPNSTLFGTWKRVGSNQYGVTAYFFSFQSPTGPAAAMLKTNQLFEVDNQNSLHGVGDLRVCDVTGQNCGPAIGSISITGTQIVPDTENLSLP